MGIRMCARHIRERVHLADILGIAQPPEPANAGPIHTWGRTARSNAGAMTFLAKPRRPRQDGGTGRSRKAVGCAGWVRRLCQATTDGAGPMPQSARELGLDVDKASIALAVARQMGRDGCWA